MFTLSNHELHHFCFDDVKGSLYQGVWLAVIGLPIALFLFYASILKGMAETEADDELYLGRKES